MIAKANRWKVSMERPVGRAVDAVCATGGSNVSLYSMPSKLKHLEGSVDERMSLPEKPPSRIPRLKKNISLRKYLQRVTTENRVRALKSEYKRLKCSQSSFSEKLKSLAPAESKMLGSYKFVAIVPNEDGKLYSDCVQELKNCCQVALDSGFMIFHNHLEYIQLAKDELEACNQKKQLIVKLKDLLHLQMDSIVENIEQLSGTPINLQASSNKHLLRYIKELRALKQVMEAQHVQNQQAHNDQISILRADLDRQLRAAETKSQQSLREVKDMQEICEAQNNKGLKELAELNKALAAKNNTIASQRAERDTIMSRNMELEQLVKESEAMAVRAQEEIERKTRSMVCLEEKLKDMQEICEAQNNKNLKELAELNKALAAKDNTIASQRAEMDTIMSRNMELEQLVKESEAMSVRAQEEIERKTRSMVCLEEKLKGERQDVIDQKDQIIYDLNLKVLSLKQFKDLYQKQLKHTRKLEAGNKRQDTTIKQKNAEISELQEKLKTAEAQLASSYQREQQLHSHLKQVKSELFRSEQLVVQLQEELNAIRETDIQRKINQKCLKSSEHPKITQMRIQLEAKEEQLSKMQRSLSCMEETVALTNQHNHMLSQLWDGQREKDLLMERQTSQPKDSTSVSKPT